MDKKEMDAKDIEQYLAELGATLQKRGVEQPIHIMIIGGAYMLAYERMNRTTIDIDIFWLEADEFQTMRVIVSECMLAVAKEHELRPDWFNFLSQILMQRDIFIPDGQLWEKFGPLHIYVPPREYILALKMLAGRDKDIVDCGILLPQTTIKTRQQAQQLLDKYVLPEAQAKQAMQIQRSFRELFREK